MSSCLPLVPGSALLARDSDLGSILQGLHDGEILLVEGDGLDDVVHLVPELGGLVEVSGGDRRLTGSSEIRMNVLY